MPFAAINGIRINYLIEGKGLHLLMFAPGGWRSVISGENTLEQILRFKSRFETSAQAA